MPQIDNDTSKNIDSGNNTLNSLGSTAKTAYDNTNNVKNAINGAQSSGFFSGLSEGITGALSTLGSEFIVVIAVVAIIIIILVLIFGALPSNMQRIKEGDIAKIEKNVLNAVEDSFDEAKYNAMSQVVTYVNSQYGCNASMLNVSKYNGGFHISTDECEIGVNMTPDVKDMVTNITAYTTSANGVIALYGETKSLEEALNINILELTVEGLKNAITYEDDDLYDATSEKFASTVEEYSNTFFVHDPGTERWDLNNFYLGQKYYDVETCYKTITNTIRIRDFDPVTGKISFIGSRKSSYTEPTSCSIDSQRECEASSKCTFTRETETRSKNCWFGDITVPMYYSLSGYRADELDTCYENLSRDENSVYNHIPDGKGGEYSVSDVYMGSLESYYNNYITLKYGNCDDTHECINQIAEGSFNYPKDNRNEIFAKLLNSGLYTEIPISGISFSYLLIMGDPGYSGILGYDGLDGMGMNAIWGIINKLRATGVIGNDTAAFNCTAFAEYWFYENYGYDGLGGDGKNMVRNLLALSNNPNSKAYGKWYQGSEPAPGGIISMGNLTDANHVLVVDAYDKERGIVTISEGNANGAASKGAPWASSINIKKEMTMSELENYATGLCSRHGGMTGCYISFANPVQ